ncbi:MAG: tetratricopeptide repeat protein [Methylotenera sp.]|nr:tetratricopeptide repeat protein [Methylotenera sp.]
MAYDLEEQEQLDELKAWWKTHGKTVTNAVLAVLVAYAGYQGWQYFQAKKAVEASTEYQALQVTDSKDLKGVQAKTATLIEKYAATPYAGRAALYAAKVNYEASDVKSAKAQLDWAIKNAKESSAKAIASMQLASILAEEKDYEGALKLLDVPHDAGFNGLFLDLKGDILVAQGKNAEAKTAYQQALTQLDTQGKYHLLTQQKLEALG